MKVFLIIWAVWFSGYKGGPTIQVIEMPSMAACQQVSAAVGTNEGWQSFGKYNHDPDTMRTKCVQTDS